MTSRPFIAATLTAAADDIRAGGPWESNMDILRAALAACERAKVNEGNPGRIRRWREAQGRPVAWLADRVGVSHRVMADIEAGILKPASWLRARLRDVTELDLED